MLKNNLECFFTLPRKVKHKPKKNNDRKKQIIINSYILLGM